MPREKRTENMSSNLVNNIRISNTYCPEENTE